MDDNSQNLDDLDQYSGNENQVDGYGLQEEDDIGIFYVRDKDSDFDLNDYAMYESDEETQPCEPEEQLNSFKITVADGTYEVEAVELFNNNILKGEDRYDMSLELRPEYLRKADEPDVKTTGNEDYTGPTPNLHFDAEENEAK